MPSNHVRPTYTYPVDTPAGMLMGFGSPIPMSQLNWISIHKVPFGQEGMPSGIYMVRDDVNKLIATIELRGELWGEPFSFNEYAFVCPIIEGWKLLH